ncbi:hypothetical protein ACVR05_09620 [Streptococcus caprae]|uniref:Fic family protein n=1 Tax=Streptococcus caprae TaxID=1640501 RepID=A0ABV8CTG3_9STRE
MLLDYIRQEKTSHSKGGLYHKVQIEMTYNSNRIEGSQLSEEQTRYIYETDTLGINSNSSLNVDDIIETTNHLTTLLIQQSKNYLRIG